MDANEQAREGREPLHYANVGKQIKEGRHVGLDFYDLLIEALIDADFGEEKGGVRKVAI